MKKIISTILGLALGILPMFAQSQFVNYSNNNESEEFTVQNLEALNSRHLDYSAIPYQNGIVFTSTRGNGGPLSCNNNFADNNYSDLYYAEMDANGEYQSPELMRGKMNGKYHDGVVTFEPNGTRMYFSRNNNEGLNDAGVKHLKIYSADLEKNVWGNFKEISFNNPDYATCHPTLSKDGMTMYFASDIPGGHGGMDIYKTTKTGETWSTPVNLGANINTSGNEIFPFVDSDGMLYFSSNGHAGNGGLDIFSAMPKGNGWSQPANLSFPLNSQWDDFGYSSFAGGKKGFLTSNRKGGKGKDDLYEWVYTGTPVMIANVCVVDAADKSRIQDAKLVIGNSKNATSGTASLSNALELTSVVIEGKKYMVFKDEKVANAVSGFEPNRSCEVSLPVRPNEKFVFSVEKPGYEPVQIVVNAQDLLAQPEYLIPLKKMILRKNIAGVVKNDKTNKPLPYSFVKIKNNCTNQLTELRTDAEGAFTMDIDCNCSYELVGSQQNFKDGQVDLAVPSFGCDNLPETVEVPLTPKKPTVPAVPSIVKEDEKMYNGKVIKLDKLFYDYDKANIRPDAANELDKVVNFLKQYPSMVIELGSHTDSRGSDEYNQKLSQRRADSAIQYIISKGIAQNRLSARGYGENQLVNRCANNVKCSDSEHQINRRTEIKVVSFDEEGVKVID